MLVKPAPGRAIRDPGTMQLVPDGGLEIDPANLFWARVLGDEDVVELTDGERAAYEAAQAETEKPAEPAAKPDAPPVPSTSPAAPALSGLAAPKPQGNDA